MGLKSSMGTGFHWFRRERGWVVECESLTGSGEMTTISTSSGSTDWVQWSLVREERFSFPEIWKWIAKENGRERKKRGNGFWGKGVVFCWFVRKERVKKWEGDWKKERVDNFWEEGNENVKIIGGKCDFYFIFFTIILKSSLLINFKFNLKIK